MADQEYEVPVKVVDRRWWANQDAQGQATATSETSSSSRKPTFVEDLEAQLAEKDRQLQDAIARYRQAAGEGSERTPERPPVPPQQTGLPSDFRILE